VTVSGLDVKAQNVSIPAGTKLGRYEIRAKTGEGGMGEVYQLLRCAQ
jgi:hypothetical protein